ncbi:MAG: chemotaxis protein CheW [Pleurocapsa sp. SU_196_0]|nr:chemotaxis protein CheW [Pleurocapsa sp. SU_196_0]
MKTSPRACLFRLGGQLFALPGEFTRQVHTVVNLRSVPKSPAMLRGLFPVRSNVLPLVSLEPLLGMDSQDHALAVQMEFEGRELAFGVSEMIGFNPVDRSNLKPVPLEAGQVGFVSSGVFLWGDQPVLVLDAAKLMTALSQAFGAVRVMA